MGIHLTENVARKALINVLAGVDELKEVHAGTVLCHDHLGVRFREANPWGEIAVLVVSEGTNLIEELRVHDVNDIDDVGVLQLGEQRDLSWDSPWTSGCRQIH